jgi:hypothetical protein
MDLAALEVALRDLSHDEKAVQLVRSFARGLGKTKQRQQIFNAPGALVRSPLDYRVADFWFDYSLFVGKNWRWRDTFERVNVSL